MGITIERAQSIIQAARRNIAYFQEVNKQEKTEMMNEEWELNDRKDEYQMGLSIDTAISLLLNITEHRGEYIPIYEEYVEAIKTGVDNMRKYQKIQEIIADWKSDGGAFEMSESYWLRLINEVLEDGSN